MPAAGTLPPSPRPACPDSWTSPGLTPLQASGLRFPWKISMAFRLWTGAPLRCLRNVPWPLTRPSSTYLELSGFLCPTLCPLDPSSRGGHQLCRSRLSPSCSQDTGGTHRPAERTTTAVSTEKTTAVRKDTPTCLIQNGFHVRENRNRRFGASGEAGRS